MMNVLCCLSILLSVTAVSTSGQVDTTPIRGNEGTSHQPYRDETTIQPRNEQNFGVFVFTKTVDKRHDSIPAGVECIEELGTDSQSFTVETSDDAALMNIDYLSQFKVLVFLSTTGEFLTEDQLLALQQFVNAGGGFVGIHAASAGMYSSQWYGDLVGAFFVNHPEIQNATVNVENRDHVIVSGFPQQRFEWVDEWYNFDRNPRNETTILLTVDETTYQNGAMGSDHPLAWCREFDGGRFFYTTMGHYDAAYQDEPFRKHLLNGILWAAKVV
ncbi:Crp/FNR family transcriptional regulator [Xylariaceae sp. FL0016]|nr:Crp/FNR family transcriptional regulator [Xylariaceae sp. FL0016]